MLAAIVQGHQQLSNENKEIKNEIAVLNTHIITKLDNLKTELVDSSTDMRKQLDNVSSELFSKIQTDSNSINNNIDTNFTGIRLAMDAQTKLMLSKTDLNHLDAQKRLDEIMMLLNASTQELHKEFSILKVEQIGSMNIIQGKFDAVITEIKAPLILD